MFPLSGKQELNPCCAVTWAPRMRKNRRTTLKMPPRLTGWSILNHIWLRRGEAVEEEEEKKREK